MAHPAPEAVVEGLWALSEESERRGDISSAVKCLEAALQHGGALLPLTEIRLRLRLASLLLSHSHNLPHAKSHLERASLLLTRIPAALPLKLAANSLLSRCYQTTAALPSQKKTILQSLRLLESDSSSSLPDPRSRLLWSCNFNAQLATALTSEPDYPAALSALDSALADASELCIPALELFFSASALHVQLLHWGDSGSVESAARRSAELWESLPTDVQRQSPGLFFYQELLQTFYLLRLSDYKAASRNADRLDAAVKEDRENVRHLQGLAVELEDVNRGLSKGSSLARKERLALGEKQRLLQEQLRESGGFEFFGGRWVLGDMLQLAPPPVDGEWLPRSAVYALVDLVVVMLGRPKGVFKECGRRIESGMKLIHEELMKLGVGDGVGEADLQSSAILMTSQYLMLLMQFLENKVVMELTRSEFVEAQQALMQMKNLFIRFPAILQGCEYIIEMLRGQYAHSVGCLHEAAFHFLEAAKLTESKSMQSMGQIYAAVSYICIGDAESSAQALDLVRPVYTMMDCFVGVREKTCIIFSYGLLLMRQHNPQEARIRLACGLKIAHQQLGNIQLVSQFLTILGSLALQLHDTGQAREILKSSLTLAKTLYDVPTQIWVLSILTDLYRELGEKENEMENSEYHRKKEDDLQKRLSEVHSRIHHLELIEKARINICTPHELDIKRAIAGPSIMVDLDIPESVGLPNPPPASSISRLRDVDSVKHTKKKI